MLNRMFVETEKGQAELYIDELGASLSWQKDFSEEGRDNETNYLEISKEEAAKLTKKHLVFMVDYQEETLH